jgi:hypothetical protein
MSTSKACQTPINLDALMKKVERIVDEQLNEIADRKSKGTANQLMKEDFAQGNPYSSHNGRINADVKKVQNSQQRSQQNNQSSTVFSKLQTGEDQMAVARLSERLKESIGRAIDEFSEGLCRQLLVATDHIEEEITPVSDEEKTTESLTSVDQQSFSGEEDLASEVQPLQSDNEVETTPAELLQQNEEEEAALSTDTDTGNASQKENPPSQNTDETKNFPPASLASDASQEEIMPSQNEDKTATFPNIPAEEQNILSPQDKEKTENFSPTPAGESTPSEEELPHHNEVTQASSPTPEPENNSQQENLFEVISSWGEQEPLSKKAPNVNSENDSGSSGSMVDPPAEKTLSETSKAIAVVNKTAAEMNQINQQRLNQYYSKKLSL